MLQVRELSKAYGSRVALDRVDLEVAPGEIMALLGRNGAGKTTLVSIVAGLRSADSGRVMIGDVDVSDQPGRAQAALGIAPQETGVYPTLSCRDNLRLFAGLAGNGRREAGPPSKSSPRLSTSPRCSTVAPRSSPAASGAGSTRPSRSLAVRRWSCWTNQPSAPMSRPAPSSSASCAGSPSTARPSCTPRITSRRSRSSERPSRSWSEAVCSPRGGIDEIVTEHSIGIVELAFAGPAPDIAGLAPDDVVTIMGSRVRIETNNPALVTAAGSRWSRAADHGAARPLRLATQPRNGVSPLHSRTGRVARPTR